MLWRTSLTKSSADLAKELGISFPSNSQSAIFLEREGRHYFIDAATKTVKEVPLQSLGSVGPTSDNRGAEAAGVFAATCAGCHGGDGKGIQSIGTPNFRSPAFRSSVGAQEMQTAIQRGKGGIMRLGQGSLRTSRYRLCHVHPGPSAESAAGVSSSAAGKPEQAQAKPAIYNPGDDVVFSLPTGRPTDRHGVYVNFAHRFPYQAAFTGRSEGAQLFGLDNFAIPSLGLRYGVTDRLSVSVFRAPSLINRPIQLMAGYNILEERKGNPLNLMVRVSIEGQDNFARVTRKT